MNQVGVIHMVTMFALALVTALVYSINMQGWRAGESLTTAVPRRFLKIIALLAYLAVIVWALSAVGPSEGAVRYVYMGIAGVLCLGVLLLIFMPSVFESALGRLAGIEAEPEDETASAGK